MTDPAFQAKPRPQPAVTVPLEAWLEIGEEHPYDRLLATLVVNGMDGCSLHLDAFRVAPSEETFDGQVRNIQRAVQWDEEVGLIHYAAGADGPWETVTINGHQYVLIATPFCT